MRSLGRTPSLSLLIILFRIVESRSAVIDGSSVRVTMVTVFSVSMVMDWLIVRSGTDRSVMLLVVLWDMRHLFWTESDILILMLQVSMLR